MKSYFQDAFEYNHAINLQLNDVLTAHPEQEDAWKLMSHIGHAQEIWLGRLVDPDFINPPLWDMMTTEELSASLASNNEGWVKFLDSLKDADFENIIVYKNTKGEEFSNKLRDILFHTINHSTHHRAQISQLLRKAGLAPAPTDYIFYIREK